MNSFVFQLLMVPPQGADGTPSNPLISFLPFIIIIAIFYFLIIRPQNKRRKETEKMLSNLSKGDKVVTIGGIHGTISGVKEKTIILKVDDNTKIEFLRSAVSTIISQAKDEEKKEIEDNYRLGDTANE